MITLFGGFGFETSSLDLVDLVDLSGGGEGGGFINPGSTLYTIYLVIVTYVYLLFYPHWYYHVLLNDTTCAVVKTWCVLPQKEWESSHSQCKETPMMVEWPYPIYVPSFDHGTHVMTCYCCWLAQHDGHSNPFPLFRFVPPYLEQ